MRRLSSCFVLLSSSVLIVAQMPPAAAQDDIPTFKTGTNQVVLHVTVTDKKGQLITNVPQSAFHVFENGEEQKLNIFRREDVPVSMGIIIDNSGSMRDKRLKVAAAAMALVKASNPQDEVFIVNFNDDAYLDCPFTNDQKKMQEALDKIDAKGGTAMRDAISMSIDYLKQAKKDKKVLLVVTDGNDNTSNESLEQLVRKARQSEVLVYSIGLLNEEEPREAAKAKRALKALAEASGGNVYYPKELPEIDRVVPQIAHEIRNQYILGYLPTNTNMDGSFRKVAVVVKGYNNPQVRTRNGYYATPEPPAKGSATPKARQTLVKQ
jgi:Ca-activated chloride channel homolog